ncbi:protein kinase domain-containing protein [Desulfomarina sp.]
MSLQPTADRLLLFNLSPGETRLIARLVTSFSLETVSLQINELSQYLETKPQRPVSLVIFHVDAENNRQHLDIRKIREHLGENVPILILIPANNRKNIRKYLKAGADDYLLLPLNQDQFSVSFLILLEIGQTMAQAQRQQTSRSSTFTWNRLINSFRTGESYFSPRTLAGNRKTEGKFNKWEKLHRLGLGGFGVVWLVKETGTGRLAVAKTPHSPALNIRVLRSAAILKRLIHHPGICQLLEVVKHNGKFILIQEYINGPTLQDLLKTKIPARDREDYFCQLLSAVAFSHNHRILHRDIKPENIMISKTGRVKLLDFGIAKDLSRQGAGRSSEGTLSYMAPEQYAGKSCLASDIWSLGIILYIFATNAVPYQLYNDEYPEDMEKELQDRAPLTINPQIDRELDRIIMGCLEVDPEKRYGQGYALQQDLFKTFPLFGSGELLPP